MGEDSTLDGYEADIEVEESARTNRDEPETLHPPRYDDPPSVLLPPPEFPTAPAPAPAKRITPLRLKRAGSPPAWFNEPSLKRPRRSSWRALGDEHLGLSPSGTDEEDWDSSLDTFINIPRSPKHPFARLDYHADSEASTIKFMEYSDRSESEASTIPVSDATHTIDPARTALVPPSEEEVLGGSDKENVKPSLSLRQA